MGKEVELICYADDLAVVVCADTKNRVIECGNQSLFLANTWMKLNKMSLAPEKTKSMFFGMSPKTKEAKYMLGHHKIKVETKVEYLGIVLDKGMTFAAEIQRASEKTKKTMRALTVLLPNTKGLSADRKAVMCAATLSILLYGAAMWQEAMYVERYKMWVMSAQRPMALRTASAYRTVSDAAVQVVAGTIPVHLLALERKNLFRRRWEASVSAEVRKMEREATLDRWQTEWRAPGKGAWTRRLIRDVRTWKKRRWGQVGYHLTQCLTGHGCFMPYLEKIGNKSEGKCMYCDETDDAEHTIFLCHRWQRKRMETEMGVGTLSAENLVEKMLETKEN